MSDNILKQVNNHNHNNHNHNNHNDNNKNKNNNAYNHNELSLIKYQTSVQVNNR
jgi:hypothetical protein